MHELPCSAAQERLRLHDADRRSTVRTPVRAMCFLTAALSLGLGGCLERTNPKGDATMSTLYGNDVAVRYARTSAERMYPAGSVLSVVTWNQQEDPRWFGAKIPQKVGSVEFVAVTGPGAYSYQRYEGSPLKKVEDGAAPMYI